MIQPVTLPLNFPGIREEAARQATELIAVGGPAARMLEDMNIGASFARLLADLTRPESQCFWLRTLAYKLNKKVVPGEGPLLRRDDFSSYTLNRECWQFVANRAEGYGVAFHDSPASVQRSEIDFRVPGINYVQHGQSAMAEVLYLALCAAFGGKP